jgi:hypothetical protein
VSQSFLLCRQCGVLHPVPVPHDVDDEAVQELAAFRAAHAVHVLEDAQGLPDSPLFDGPTWDPMSTRWLRVTAGADVLLVRSWRASIDEPRRHELTTAPPPAIDCIEVDEPLLRRALDRHFYPQTVRAAKLERFVHTVRELIADLDPNEVETSFDDVALPNASIGPFPAQLCDTLIDRCTPIFDMWEMERVRTFVADHRLEDGALAVRVRRILSRSAA